MSAPLRLRSEEGNGHFLIEGVHARPTRNVRRLNRFLLKVVSESWHSEKQAEDIC